jgi:hypothetical protein
LARKMIGGVLLGLVAVTTVHADVVTDWNEATLNAIRTDLTAPPRASRFLAMVHVAVYDAVNGIDPTHQSYLVTPDAPAGASAEAAAVAAAHTVLVAAFPAHTATFDAQRSASLASIADGTAKDNGVQWGETVGAAVLAARANDGSALAISYAPGANPGDWAPTPPALAAAALPQWPYVIPFALTSGAQFRPDGPPAIDSAEYTDAFNEVKEIGSATSSSRTAEQTEIALFWINGPGTATPPGHWNSITQRIAEQEGNTLAENARLFALLNIALADAAIVSWDCKYSFNNWRPVTAIRAADSDGNDQTQADSEWTPLIPTPPFPDYTSGHSTFSAAASVVLAKFFGTDNIPFETNSDAQPNVIRSYASFSQAADESGRSRVYGGIHWEFSNQDGLSTGRAVGEYVSDSVLKALPNDAPRPRVCGTLNLGGLVVMMLFTGLRFGSRRR